MKRIKVSETLRKRLSAIRGDRAGSVPTHRTKVAVGGCGAGPGRRWEAHRTKVAIGGQGRGPGRRPEGIEKRRSGRDAEYFQTL